MERVAEAERGDAGKPAAGGSGINGGGESALSSEELRLIDQLSATDRQVRTHELAHMAAGAGLAGGASFTYQVGPDNQRYAVAGEVSIDTSPAGDPAATLAKAEQIRAAALAPADPSPQDQKVAAMAARMASAARLELAALEGVQGRQAQSAAAGPRVGAGAAAYRSVADGPGKAVEFSAFA
ncbi:MAG: hypothetical protein H6941_05455 [Candidatus Accumulibacter sp.]|nr:hypothetical protein [Accumulibacter sp.]